MASLTGNQEIESRAQLGVRNFARRSPKPLRNWISRTGGQAKVDPAEMTRRG